VRVRVDSISKVYPAPGGGRLVALEDVSLDVADGELVTILGPSGCGKSTLLQIVAGLERRPAGITFEGASPGVPLTAMVFQEHALFPWRTVRDNVTFGLEVRGVPAAERRAASRRLLALVGLEGFADRYPHHISGGMRQRVAIARAFAVEPALLLMDEPFLALDAHSRALMQLELLALWERGRRSILYVTHLAPPGARSLARAVEGGRARIGLRSTGAIGALC
jgi:NitT/TauT family transport system ATP-binding protein